MIVVESADAPLPDVAVTSSVVLACRFAEADGTIVKVDEPPPPHSVAGLNEAETPAGTPEIANWTPELKPFRGFTVNTSLAEEPP